MVNGRLMESERWSGAGLARLQATRTGDRGLGEATRTRYRAVPGVGDEVLDASTRDGDGRDGLARARPRAVTGRFVQARRAESEERGRALTVHVQETPTAGRGVRGGG
jgi:hypothetical protein